jgi:hypothetical protein
LKTAALHCHQHRSGTAETTVQNGFKSNLKYNITQAFSVVGTDLEPLFSSYQRAIVVSKVKLRTLLAIEFNNGIFLCMMASFLCVINIE